MFLGVFPFHISEAQPQFAAAGWCLQVWTNPGMVGTTNLTKIYATNSHSRKFHPWLHHGNHCFPCFCCRLPLSGNGLCVELKLQTNILWEKPSRSNFLRRKALSVLKTYATSKGSKAFGGWWSCVVRWHIALGWVTSRTMYYTCLMYLACWQPTCEIGLICVPRILGVTRRIYRCAGRWVWGCGQSHQHGLSGGEP